ncbi:hypothetical protein [uncultured Microbulbifer sp.]|uniref:hypothetical protein n=1 Tax=uncultured Microbulbifer sp. TaxID=348147 RepID=UPI00262E3593|nr:hypothetical protein [uncultured Microbulbifer sp.]
MAESARELLQRLLARGDGVAVNRGRLTLAPASGCPVPAEWLSKHEQPLIIEVARLASVEALEYIGYSVGNYGPRKNGGVTLQFRSLLNGHDWYAIFNAYTTRARTTKHGKAGSPLPKGRFRMGKRSSFLKFWGRTGQRMPKSFDAFGDYMGKLRSQVFTGIPVKTERLNAATLAPLYIEQQQLPSCEELNASVNLRVSSGLNPGKVRVNFPGKQLAQPQQPRGLQPNQTTGDANCGNTVIRECGYKGIPKPPKEQTNEEWLEEYGRAG